MVQDKFSERGHYNFLNLICVVGIPLSRAPGMGRGLGCTVLSRCWARLNWNEWGVYWQERVADTVLVCLYQSCIMLQTRVVGLWRNWPKWVGNGL